MALINPEEIRAAVPAEVFNRTVTFQQQSQTVSSAGEITDNAWSDVAGLVNIPCFIEPIYLGGAERGKQVVFDQIYVKYRYTVMLNGFYPAIEERYRAVINGAIYVIEAVDSDICDVFTTLTCQKVH